MNQTTANSAFSNSTLSSFDKIEQLVPVEKVAEISCLFCFILKPIAAFYKRTPTRVDRTCIDCRRKERRDRYQFKLKKTCNVSKTPKGIIEPEVKSNLEIIKIKTAPTFCSKGVNKVNFDDLDNMYGMQLTSYEQIDTVQRFNEFVALLAEGYGEITKSKIYLRKN